MTFLCGCIASCFSKFELAIRYRPRISYFYYSLSRLRIFLFCWTAGRSIRCWFICAIIRSSPYFNYRKSIIATDRLRVNLLLSLWKKLRNKINFLLNKLSWFNISDFFFAFLFIRAFLNTILLVLLWNNCYICKVLANWSSIIRTLSAGLSSRLKKLIIYNVGSSHAIKLLLVFWMVKKMMRLFLWTFLRIVLLDWRLFLFDN